MLVDIAKNILKDRYACDNCLGRQFGQLLSGLTNAERGRAIRTILAMEYSAKPFAIELSNLSGYNLRKKKDIPNPGKCSVCEGVFRNMEHYVQGAVSKTKGIGFKTFIIGTRLSPAIIKNEEELWESAGIEFCEPIKAEINREAGKLFSRKTGKTADEKNPEVSIILDFSTGSPDVKANPIFFYGKYKKLVRGIPQTKWDKYRTTVEDIIAKPFIRQAGSADHDMHAAGREDIDARCLDWRPFIIQINSPKNRAVDLRKIQREINSTKKVMVTGMRRSDRNEVVGVKNLSPDKTYKVIAAFEKDIQNLGALRKIVGQIKQQTPRRVLHRRADKTRLKRVKSVKFRRISNKRLEMIIKGEAGLYIKELVTGDCGRTVPSISGILGNKAEVKELDVIKIHLTR